MVEFAAVQSAVAKKARSPLVVCQMSTVGERLRAAREARHLRVQEVAEATNMRTDHIIALEEGDYSSFPAPVYIRGSVRTYAKLLKLDVMPLMDALATELDQGGQVEALPEGRQRRRGILEFLALRLAQIGWKRGVIILVVLALLALLLLIVSGHSTEAGKDPLADLPPPTYKPTKSSESGYLPLPATNR